MKLPRTQSLPNALLVALGVTMLAWQLRVSRRCAGDVGGGYADRGAVQRDSAELAARLHNMVDNFRFGKLWRATNEATQLLKAPT